MKTEADFPKENGLYFCVDQNRHYIGERSFDKADKINLHIWSGVNWYLQPVTDKEATTEQEKPQTAEEIRQITELFNIYQKHLHENSSYCGIYIPDYELSEITKEIIQLYASQGQSLPSVLPGDIEKQLLDKFGFTEDGIDAENQLKIFSFMDWLKSQLKQGYPKE